MEPRSIELLAPAKNYEIAIDAINHGADAIYIGARGFGARAAAGNSIEDIAKVVDYAHQFNVKVYVTINTIIKDNEISDVEKLITELYEIGVDALIVQDLGILRMNIPPIQLHASTQCDICDVEKALFLQNLGFSQLVLARELSLDEIKEIKSKTNVPLEGFIHGALCVSYSGRCHVSYATKGRSANRGECAQICRLPYDVFDGNGSPLMMGKHILSLRDLNRSENVDKLVEAGISSLKIEGRLKDSGYVKNVVAGYHQKLDNVIANNPDKYKRESVGHIEFGFTPVLNRSFNRGFTNYFLERKPNEQKSMAMLRTPKSLGEPIGEVTRVFDNKIWVKSTEKLSNGDGLSFFNANDEYEGFRVNKVEGDIIYTLTPIEIKKGTQLYRTYNKDFSDKLETVKTRRYINVEFTLEKEENMVFLVGEDERGEKGRVIVTENPDMANSSQSASQERVLSKLGNTIYKASKITTLDNLFIPSSLLTEARRNLLEILDAEHKANYKRPVRDVENISYRCHTNKLSYKDNVANELAKKVYMDHGVESDNIEMAIETGKGKEITSSDELMTTRYCIRRELDCCLKESNGSKYTNPFVIKSGDLELRVEFDCKNCEMKIFKNK